MTVSAILTIYNGEKYVEQMLKSLLFQIHVPEEIICVDDGSTDGSLKVLRRFSERYPFIRVYAQKNTGAPGARLAGLSRATGDAVVFVDCDDMVDPDFISSLCEALESADAQMAVGGYAREYPDGRLISMEMMDKREDFSPADVRMVWVNTAIFNKMFLRKAIPEGITLPRIKQGDDLAFLCRVLPQVEKVTFVSKPMYHYYVREGSQMASFDLDSFRNLREEFAACAEGVKGTPIFDTIVAVYFISLCFSQLQRYYALDKQAGKDLNRETLAFFDQRVPGWRKARSFRFFPAIRQRARGLALWGSQKLFIHGMFPVYEGMMKFIQEKLHWRAKW